MCGIAAVFKHKERDLSLRVVMGMGEIVAHRGPDGSGQVGLGGNRSSDAAESTDWEVALVHRRLSILDLSPAAAQPMVYRGRYWLAHNGEVYNYVELRAELEGLGHRFRTASDSEVILAAFAEWGPLCFQRMRGMWGLVLVDVEGREAYLCRDRMGIKPLYLWRGGALLAAVSEIKQLVRAPGFRARRSEGAMREFLATGYEDESRSFFADVAPVPPGTYVKVSTDGSTVSAPQPYWFPERIEVEALDAEQAAESLVAKLRECVALHLRSDVPVGCALSGGLDSSAVTLLAYGLRDSQKLHTFTASFPGEAIDERHHVQAILERVHAQPHFVAPTAEGFLDDVADFVWHHDEPVLSLSMYAGWCVARSTRSARVPVSLAGQGGDEVLFGYWQSYFMYLRELARRGRWAPLTAHLAGALLPGGNASVIRQIPVMLRRYRARRRDAVAVMGGASRSSPVLQRALALEGQERRVNEIRRVFLPRLLKWDDRNAMAFSTESRYPFLDHELIELCLSFPPGLFYHRGWVKWPLRSGLQGVLPASVARRPDKVGYWVPQDRWLCGPLRPTLRRWLASERPLWNFVDPERVRRVAAETWASGGRREEPGQALVRCFMLDQWLEAFDVAA